MPAGNLLLLAIVRRLFITKGAEQERMRKEIERKGAGGTTEHSSSVGFQGHVRNADKKPNNSSANCRLPACLAQSITMPAGLLGSICYSLSGKRSGVSLEGNSLTGQKKD